MKTVSANLLALFAAVLVGDAARVAAQVPQDTLPAAQIPVGRLPTMVAAAPQVSPAPAAPTQVPEIWLMLKNGSTFSARMLSTGERVKLRVNDGDIEIRASEISLTGYSLTDLAEQQWALLHQQQLDKQFPFVDWCARYHLYDHADAALAQMEQGGQDTPRVKGYQVRIARLRAIQQEQQAAAAQLAATPPTSMATMSPPPVASLPTAVPATAPLPSPPVGPLPAPGTSAPATTASLLLPANTNNTPLSLNSPAVVSAKPPASGHSGEEQEAFAAAKAALLNSPNPGNLTPAAVELFAARVQPWVVSRCSNVGCHDMGGTNSYKLERYSKQEAIPRATTLKNLAATTRLILMDKPEESPLLVMSTRAHGTSLTPPLAAGDAYALAAFREFVALATGRELPKESKADPTNANAVNNLPGQVTPGRATFPASAAEEPAPENKAIKVINQNSAGWQAAIERQRAIDAELQKLQNLETGSQRANEVRGLIADPAVKPAAVVVEVPAAATPAATTLPVELKPYEHKPNLPLPQNKLELPGALPDSLLPKSIAKSKLKPDAEPTTAASNPEAGVQESAPTAISALKETAAPQVKPTPPINLNRPRRQFPLPPEDTPPAKAVGTGNTKRR
jgi:hypothetical protein